MNELVEFLRDTNSRVTYGDKWMCVDGDGEDVIYTVYQKRYGKRKTTVLYRGVYFRSALIFLKDEE